MACALNPFQILKKAVAFKDTNQPPLMIGPVSPNIFSRIANIPLEKYHSSVDSKLEAHFSFFQRYPDVVLLYPPCSEYNVERLAFGIYDNKPVLKDIRDVDSVEVPDPYSNDYCLKVLNETKSIVKKTDDKYQEEYAYPYFGLLSGPVRLATYIRGPENLYVDMIRYPDETHELLMKTCEFSKRWLKAQKFALNKLCFFYIAEEEVAFISSKHSAEYVLPYMKDIKDSFKESIMIWHSDPNINHALEIIYDVSPDILNFKSIDFEKALRRFFGKICLLGGVNCEVLATSSPEVIEKIVKKRVELARQIVERKVGFICSSTAILEKLENVPIQNLDTLIHAIKKFW